MNKFVKTSLIFFFGILMTAPIFAQNVFDFDNTQTDGSNMNNWILNGSSPVVYATASDFVASGTVFNFSNAATCDLGGLTIGEVIFKNSNSKGSVTSVIVGSGETLTINSITPPTFSKTKVNYNFQNSGTVAFTATSSSSTQILPDIGSYYNLLFSGSNKRTSSTSGYTYFLVVNNLTETDGKKITIEDGLEIGSSFTFSVQNNTEFEMMEPYDQSYYVLDSRTSTKTFPGIWRLQNINNAYTVPYSVNNGEYYSLIIECSANLNGNTTVTNNLEIKNSKYLGLNGKVLTLEGTNTFNSSGRLRGSNTSTLICKSTTATTLYFDQTSESNRTLKDLKIQGNSVVVNLGNWLSITGGTSTTGYGVVDVVAGSSTLYTQGYLTLKSNQYGTAMIGANPGNVAYSSSSNVGTLLVENYIAGNSTKGRQYRFLSSPVSGGVFWQWRDSSNNRSGRGTQITGKTGTVNIANDSFDISTTNHPSAFYYDETKAGNTTGIGNTSASEDAGWSRLINAKTGTIENGKGYRVLIRGDRSITLTSSTTTTPVNTTIQTRGGYVAGPVSVPITNSSTKTNNGINLVGNPYACAVDWVTVQSNSTSVDPTYVAFDVSSKSYQSYNATGGGGLMSRYISPGQGFLVYTTAASTSLVFPTSAKTTAQAGGRIFTEIKNNHLVTRLMKDSGTYDATIIYFIKGATNYYDAYDAGHIENSNVNLSSVDSTNTLYNLNCMDSLVGTRIIPLSLYGTPAGTYTMAFDDVNTFKNHDVYLIDNYLQKTIKVDDMTQYQVNVNTDKLSYTEGRLFISFEPKPVNSVLTMSKTEIFNISPNPVKDQLNIKLENQLMGTIEYEIYNISGQSILSGAFNSNEAKINTSNLLTGIYFINLRANNETQTIKFIK